jgi:hypothetical protein
MPRFVVLEHDHPELHWDFLIEAGAVLRAWRLKAPPAPGQLIEARANFDHRLFYLDHEGPVSGGRGTVKRWDAGSFRLDDDRPGNLALTLLGSRLVGNAELRELAEPVWSFRFDPS